MKINMEKERVLKILNELKSIKPDKGYGERSLMLILASKQNEAQKAPRFGFKTVIESLRISAVVGVIGFLLATLMGGVSYINKNYSPLSLEGLNSKSLVAEANSIDNSIQITLQEIKYLDQSNKKAIKTIDNVSKNDLVYTATTTSVSSTSSTTEDNSPLGEIEKMLMEKPSTDTGQSIDELLDKLSQ